MKIEEKIRCFGRLEDIIRVAETGRQVQVGVELVKLPVVQELSIKEENDLHEKHKTYVLIAYYSFKLGNEAHTLSKVYMFATGEESLNSIEVNKKIANARLQVDYRRLRAAGIRFEEKFF